MLNSNPVWFKQLPAEIKLDVLKFRPHANNDTLIHLCPMCAKPECMSEDVAEYGYEQKVTIQKCKNCGTSYRVYH